MASYKMLLAEFESLTSYPSPIEYYEVSDDDYMIYDGVQPRDYVIYRELYSPYVIFHRVTDRTKRTIKVGHHTLKLTEQLQQGDDIDTLGYKKGKIFIWEYINRHEMNKLLEMKLECLIKTDETL